MSMISIDNLTAGMVLASDLSCENGRMLLKAGTELEDRHFAMLQRMGVKEADILSIAELDDDALYEIESYVREFFLYVNPDDAVNQAMFSAALERTAQRVAEGWELPSWDERRASTVEHLEDLFLRDMGGPEDIVKHEAELESFPDIYFRIKEVLEDPAASADHVAEVVSTDVGLSAKLLKFVNSPFYGFPSSIDSIARAVALVGSRELTTLALGISTINYFKDIPPELVDMKTFWRHSISCGIFSRILASKQAGLAPERLFIGGLLHDVGRLIMFKKLPYASTEAMLFARENSIPLVEAEETIVGYSHTAISEPLLKEWRFPEHLADMINFHHTPMTFPNPLEPAIVHVADNLANAANICDGGMYVVPGIDDGAWELLGLKAEFVEEAFADYEKQIDHIFEAFFGG